jgi:hypothetical protein
MLGVNRMEIERLVLTIARTTIQAGIPNEEYPVSYLYDSRLTHHIPTHFAMKWKGYEKLKNSDSKFFDCVSSENKEKKAEGKVINKKRGVNLSPSRDTGANRKFSQKNLDDCFEINSYYFLYETVEHTDLTLTFHIYWVPVHTIKEWYDTHGRNGTISYNNIKACITECEILQTLETRD